MQNQVKAKKTGAEMFFTNPMIRKIAKIEETSTEHATYASIGNKCAFFMAMVLLGVVLLLGLQTINPDTVAMDDGSVITISDAALLAAQILAVSDDALAAKLDAKRASDAKAVLDKDAALQAELNK